uniref:Cation/H+ exchanger transmembrane domain-containing protein n=1 Tax=Arcella intermedia TaxID=1963864 RepID=A0A6B2L4C9_9EUKA
MVIISVLVTLFIEKKEYTLISASTGQIMVGAVAGLIFRYSVLSIDSVQGVDPSLFQTLFLPIIIFEAGWNSIETRWIFMHNLGTISIYAILGTIVTSGIIGLILFGFRALSFDIIPLSVLDVIVFSALLASTDPVATMSIFGQLRAHPLLNTLVFGESILNDAVAIILYKTFVEFYGEPLVWTSEFILTVIGKFLLNTFGSLGIGIALALIASKVTQKVDMFPVIELILVLLCAMLSYLLTDFLELSGVTAIFFFGLVSKHYLWFNLTKQSREFTDTFFRTLKDIAEITIFTLLGVQLFMFDWKYYNWPMIGVSLFACLFSRLYIIPFSIILNCFRKKPQNKITNKMQLIMWWAGVRGAVAYALAVGIKSYQESLHFDNSTDYIGGAEMEETAYEEMVTTTHTVVIITILILGTSTGPVLKSMKLAGDHVIAI